MFLALTMLHWRIKCVLRNRVYIQFIKHNHQKWETRIHMQIFVLPNTHLPVFLLVLLTQHNFISFSTSLHFCSWIDSCFHHFLSNLFPLPPHLSAPLISSLTTDIKYLEHIGPSSNRPLCVHFVWTLLSGSGEGPVLSQDLPPNLSHSEFSHYFKSQEQKTTRCPLGNASSISKL